MPDTAGSDTETASEAHEFQAEWLKELSARGLIQDFSDAERLEKFPKNSGFYVGFDPTAPSLQLGNLVPLVVAMHLAKAGFRPVILFGGATGAIGDPSGKDKERSLLERETIEKNIETQKTQVEQIFSSHSLQADFVNNFDWTHDMSVLEFLRDIGKHFTVNYMLAKEVVKTRLDGHGISFTEFSYMLLQAMDFEYLFRKHDISMQFGGSDQWGNITAGLELIRRKGTGEAVAFSFPLLTNSEGKKFGKSEDGAIWLAPSLTSPFRMHQFLLNIEDEDSLRYLRVLTFLSLEEISEIERKHREHPEQRLAQTTLADQLVALIHGDDAVAAANRCREVLFGGSLDGLSEAELFEIFEGVPSSEAKKDETLSQTVLECFANSSLAGSKGEAKRLITQGGAYLNNQRIDDLQTVVKDCALPFENVIVLRSGKKKYHLVKLTS